MHISPGAGPADPPGLAGHGRHHGQPVRLQQVLRPPDDGGAGAEHLALLAGHPEPVLHPDPPHHTAGEEGGAGGPLEDHTATAYTGTTGLGGKGREKNFLYIYCEFSE